MRIEIAQDHRRIFIQIGHQLKQRGVFMRAQTFAAVANEFPLRFSCGAPPAGKTKFFFSFDS